WLVHVVEIDSLTVKRVAWINAESGAVIFPIESKGIPAKEKLQLCCSMARTEFVVGEVLPPPKTTLRNNTDAAVDVIGATITVIGCTLVQPDKVVIPMYVAMPPGVDPLGMPSRELKAGAEATFTPVGIWLYEEGVGFRSYVFQQEGCYELKCHCGDATSNTIAITVRAKASASAAQSDRQ
nr:hypothetical protein [Gemmatimonadales bacterium]